MKRASLTISVILALNVILFAQAPVADFTCTVLSAAPPNCNFQFLDLSTNTPQNWFWNFCDGTSSTWQNPTHWYSHMGTYCVILIATNSFGSDTILCDIIVDSTGCYCCTGSTEIEFIELQKNNVTVYPNPATTELHVKVREAIESSYTITIYDTQGKAVDIITTNEHETVIDISKYPQGIYWVRVLGNNIDRSEKIIKIMTN